jgi:hypothetical protein
MRAGLGQEAISVLAHSDAAASNARAFDFYLYFLTEGAAAAVGRELAEVGFRCAVCPGAQGQRWLCLAAARIVPSEEALDVLGHLMTTMAEDFGGEYVGWEARLQTH